MLQKYADWWNIPDASPKTYKHKLEVLKKRCKTVNRDFNKIVKTSSTMIAISKSKNEALKIAEKVHS